MVEPTWFSSAVAAVKAGTFRPYADTSTGSEFGAPMSYVNNGGVAHIQVIGQIAKGESSFGGASSVAIRQQVRAAVADDQVGAILLHIDSPGGTVAGTAALADDIRAADAKKPVHAHVEDLGASAAYWIAAQARRVTAERTSLVGSIGTVAYVVDTSKEYDANGWTAHVISSGGMKGAFADGVPITPEQIDYLQSLVDESTAHFVQAVAEGRKMDPKEARALADGRIHDAAKAKKIGLIDAVSTVDEVVARIGEKLRIPSASRAQNRLRSARIADLHL
jgi:protease-4